jgi:hypothetical protein
MWDPELQIPVEFRNLEPIWRKLNKVRKVRKGRVQKARVQLAQAYYGLEG